MNGAPSTAYRAPRWLPGGHAQTLWPLAIKGPLPAYRRERWETPDGDFIDLDHVGGPASAPRVVLFHGLEGSSRSHYARRLMAAVEAAGWRGTVVHFRGCSGEPNRLPRAYHSGDSAEIDWILRRLAGREPRLYVAGVSLGGNALLKWLAEWGDDASQVVCAAAAACAPLDLAAANESLSSGFNRIYARHFLRSLVPAALDKNRRFPGLVDPDRICASRTLRDFDDAVTAPLHGFRDAAHYYASSSAGPLLSAVRTPTLVLQADNDPFLPTTALPSRSSLPSSIDFQLARGGGHVGFVGGGPPGDIDWLPRRILRHFHQCAR